jgi:hypothetical protein
MAIKDWSTNYPTEQDVLATVQPDLQDDVDNTRVTHIHTVRNKVQQVALQVGDENDLPAGCLRERVQALEDAGGGGSDRYLVWHEDTHYFEAGISFVTQLTRRIVRDSNKPPLLWRIVIGLWNEGSYGGRAQALLKIGDLGETPHYDSVVIYSDLSFSEAVYSTTLLPTDPDNEPQDTVLDIAIDLRCDTSGDTAHMQYMDLYALTALPPTPPPGPG